MLTATRLLTAYQTRLLSTSYNTSRVAVTTSTSWQGYRLTRRSWPALQRIRMASTTSGNDAAVDKIRNIGIIAHIDAGKTTTTERMLYYAGLTRRIGEVDSGDTVTDYLTQERERGITIQAAAVTLGWRDAKINLIDTPGHVDFTVEVERSIRVLDGAVAVLDGAAGVEAQTETVWRQADRYDVPRLVFANKMDRVGASWHRVLSDLSNTLGAIALPVQLPYFKGTDFIGIIDIVRMELLTWNKADSGSTYGRELLGTTHLYYNEALLARNRLVEQLAELDDDMMEVFLAAEDTAQQNDHNPLELIAIEAIQSALRRCTLANRAVPVLCGSSLRNMGVQPLMDAVIDYLPSPLDCTAPQGILNDGSIVHNKISPTADKQELCALAFKVISDVQRGPMVFVRVYSGILENRSILYNVNTNTKERVNRLFQMYGDQTEPLDQLSAGNIGVLVGLKHTRTGDTLVLEQQHRRQRNAVARLAGVDIPPPVFFCAIEPASSADEKPLQEALDHLLLEDPSLRVRLDNESGQTLLCGQGELHLEVVGDRLKRDFNVRAEQGKVRISYRETIAIEHQITLLYDRELFGTRGRAKISMTLTPMMVDSDTGRPISPYNQPVDTEGNVIHINPECLTEETITTATATSTDQRGTNGLDMANNSLDNTTATAVVDAVREGIEAGLARGSLLGFPVTHVAVRVDQLVLFANESTPAALRACAGQAIGEGLAQAQPTLLEPTMRVQIRVPERHVGAVMSDLGGGTRRGRILSMDDDSDDLTNQQESTFTSTAALKHDTNTALAQHRRLSASVPLAGLLGYASALRSLTAGTGTFTMELYGYGSLSATQQQAILTEMRGY
ncbi:P-loop containing nucleoside triphosphate hydrolase protein [Syncephalis fuscata]|nr:P-loop containing nucleoside triphosphate hydrolase protein [Syncephalis fuscata]